MIVLTHVSAHISFVALTLGTLFASVTCQDMLGSLNVYPDNITLSGFSSGGAMAQMFQISYSSLFRGVAVFSHTFYRCGPPNGDIDEYDRFCTTLFNLTDSEMYDTAKVHEDIREYLAMGLIEDPMNLKDKRLYVYSGLKNLLFTPTQSLKVLQVYEPYIQNAGAIKTRVQDAVQLLPTDNYGGPCNESAETTDFIGNCGFSGVTEAINFILFDDTNSTEAFQKQNTTRGNVSTFDQTEFTKDLINHNMDDIGFYYIPQQCLANASMPQKCYLHFYFHGCLTGNEFNGPRHVENTGLLELAEKKGIVMIFPQAKSSVANPIGCWDTFGVAGQYYATQQGPQITAVKRMLDRILSSGMMDMVTTTTMSSADLPESTKSISSSSRLSIARTPTAGGYPQRLKVPSPRKLTYLPPPPSQSVAALAPLRRNAYKAVKYSYYK